MLRIRNARAQDFTFVNDGIRDLERQYRQLKELLPVFPKAEETFKDMLNDPKHHQILVAEIDGKPVGSVAVQFSQALHYGGKCAEVQDLYVDPNVRQKGVGKALLQRVKEIAEERDVIAIELMAAPPGSELDEERSLFYKKCGYKFAGMTRNLILQHHDIFD